MPLTTSTEIERKYDVDDTIETPDLSSVASFREEEAVTLRAVYFDTADNSLANNATVLRRRSGGHDEGWHVKRPTTGGRTEIHAPLGDASSTLTPPDEILDVVRALLNDKALQETARLTTERSTITLLDTDGTALAAVTDDLVSATDVRSGILRVWREWEVELSEEMTSRPQEATALLDRIEKVLIAAGAEPSRSASKFARATGRSTPNRSTPGRDEEPVHNTADGSPTALETANLILGGLTGDLVAAEPRVRADDNDAVHTMRILVRRLRGVLAAFSGVWSPDAVTALREQLRQLGDVLGAARDAEVRQQRAESLLEQDDPNAKRRLVDDAHGEYEAHLTELVQYFDSADYTNIFAALRALADAEPATDLAVTPARATLRKALRRQQRRSRRRLARADRNDLDSLHSARKAARRLRYVAEALTADDSPVLGNKVRALADAAEQVQDVLGGHRDAVLFLERLAEASTQAMEAGESTAVYAAMETAERKSSLEALERVDDAEQNLSRAAKL